MKKNKSNYSQTIKREWKVISLFTLLFILIPVIYKVVNFISLTTVSIDMNSNLAQIATSIGLDLKNLVISVNFFKQAINFIIIDLYIPSYWYLFFIALISPIMIVVLIYKNQGNTLGSSFKLGFKQLKKRSLTTTLVYGLQVLLVILIMYIPIDNNILSPSWNLKIINNIGFNPQTIIIILFIIVLTVTIISLFDTINIYMLGKFSNQIENENGQAKRILKLIGYNMLLVSIISIITSFMLYFVLNLSPALFNQYRILIVVGFDLLTLVLIACFVFYKISLYTSLIPYDPTQKTDDKRKVHYISDTKSNPFNKAKQSANHHNLAIKAKRVKTPNHNKKQTIKQFKATTKVTKKKQKILYQTTNGKLTKRSK